MYHKTFDHCELIVGETPSALAQLGGDFVHKLVESHPQNGNSFRMAWAGGSTPLKMYSNLAALWSRDTSLLSKLEVFQTDERHVPCEHASSNLGNIQRSIMGGSQPLFDINGFEFKNSANESAFNYQAMLRRKFELSGNDIPQFDLLVLGIGTDGHIASIFPCHDECIDTTALATDLWVESLQAARLTITMPVVLAAKRILMIVSGSEKSAIVRDAFSWQEPTSRHPASYLLGFKGNLTWLADRAAASML